MSSIKNLVVTLDSNLSMTQRSRIQVNTNILTDETNGTSAPLMGMADGKGLWMNILFEIVIMASVFVVVWLKLFVVSHDLTSVVQF